MFRRIVAGLVGVMFTVLLMGQNDESKAPLSEDYQDYLERPENYRTGYIPHPFKMSFEKKVQKGVTMYPEVFDLREENAVTSIKDQGSYGTCWAFAALASIESTWLRSTGITYDFSERNMAHCHGFEWGPEEGGNSTLAASYLTRLTGPYLEAQDPYGNMGVSGCVDFGDTILPQAYVTNYIVTGGVEMTKYMIYKYGAVATSMSTDNFYSNYNSYDNTFYYKGSSGVDHGVSIVGWNDTIKVTGSSSGTPASPGVWIVKNSWGLSFGEQGYFYVSYEDSHVGAKVSLYPERLEVNEIDTLYMFDDLGAVGSHGFPEAENRELAYALTKFTAPRTQLLNRLGTFVSTGGTMLEFVVAKSWDGIQLSDTIGEFYNLVCRFPGYYSFETSLEIDSGDFYVMAKYKTPGYNYPIPVEERESGFAIPVLETGNQWASSDGVDWKSFGALGEYKKDLCIRAYAKNMDEITASFVADRKIYCLGMETQLINQSVGMADSFIWKIKGAHLDTSVVSYQIWDTVKIAFDVPGLKTVRLIAFGADTNDTLLRTNYVEVVESPEVYISLNGTRSTVARGKPVTLTAFGAEDYLWDLGDGKWTLTDQVIKLVPENETQWIKVKGLLGSCSSTDSLLITTVVVEHDDIKDAKYLLVNTEYGPFSNRYATVEDDEPAPDEGDCDTQSTWCVEGGLHNSIWFRFEAPITGEVSVYSFGFDNQLALYEATATGGWEDILSGDPTKYRLIAANDDAHDVDYSAEIDKVSGLTPGKTYWIQSDGSAGGDEGEISIEVKASLPTLTRFPIIVRPNPYMESMTVDIRGLNLENAHLKVYSMEGRCVLNKTVSDYFYTFDRSSLAPGHYILEIRAESTYYRTKFTCID